MTIGLVGKKQGMTRIFTPEGEGYAVSVVSVNPNTITQIKSLEVDGYSSVQVTTGEKKEKHIKKPISGHYKKKGINPGDGLWEFRVDPEKLEDLEVGGQLFLEQFEDVNFPETVTLHQAYPNPFNPISNINYSVDIGQIINISVFDLNGRLIHTLVNDYHLPGYYKRNFSGHNLSSGFYFISLNNNNRIQTQKIILTK